MPDSLFDFGNIAQFAQNNLQNAQRLYQMRQQDRQLGLRDRELDIRDAQEQNSAMNAQTARLNTIKSYLDHPLVQNTPELQDKLFETVAPELGIPIEGLGDKLTQSRADRIGLLKATLGKDEEKATESAIKLASMMNNDEAAKFLKNIESLHTLYEKVQHAHQVVQVNGEEFAKMRQGQANINEGLQDITALSSQMRREVAVLDTKEYKNAQKFYNTLNKASILDPADKTLPKQEKLALSSLFPDNAKAKADGIAEQMKSVKYQLDTATHALDDIELHGAPQAGNMKEKLTARVATLMPIYGTLSAMHDFYKDPLNSQNAANAKMAYENIEAKRSELVSLEKKLDSQRQRLVGKVNEKFEYDQAQDSAIAEAQRRFLALPESQRTASSAGRISQALQKELGVDVLPEKIYKDPNRPSTELKVEMTQEKAEAKKVGEFSGEQFGNLQKADFDSRAKMAKYDRMDQLLKGIETGKLEPAKTTVQAIAESMGFSVDPSLPAKQAFTALAGEVALSLRSPAGGAGMPGALSDKDLSFLQSMTPDIAKTPAGNRLIIETARKLAKRDQEIAKLAREYRKKHGAFDAGFLDEIEARYKNNHLFSDQGTQSGKSSSAQPGKAQPQSGAVLQALPQGSKQIGTSGGKPVYQDATGKKWIGE